MLARVCKLLTAALALQVLCPGAADAKIMSKADMHAKQAAAQRLVMQAASKRPAGTGVKNITFSNPRASGAQPALRPR